MTPTPATTSTILTQFFGEIASRAALGEKALMERIVQPYPSLAEGFFRLSLGRAAFAIPQVCVALGLETTTGRSSTATELEAAWPFSLICLSLAVGDDLIDPDGDDFGERMLRAWTAMTLSSAGSRLLYSATAIGIRDHLQVVIDTLLNDIAEVAAAEIEAARHPYDEQTYMANVRRKTSAYTRHGLLLGARLGGANPATHLTLSKVGGHLGSALQLVDDALDAETDAGSDQPATMATVLRAGSQSIRPLYDLALKEIEAAVTESLALPHPETLVSTLRRAATFLRWAS